MSTEWKWHHLLLNLCNRMEPWPMYVSRAHFSSCPQLQSSTSYLGQVALEKVYEAPKKTSTKHSCFLFSMQPEIWNILKYPGRVGLFLPSSSIFQRFLQVPVNSSRRLPTWTNQTPDSDLSAAGFHSSVAVQCVCWKASLHWSAPVSSLEFLQPTGLQLLQEFPLGIPLDMWIC